MKVVYIAMALALSSCEFNLPVRILGSVPVYAAPDDNGQPVPMPVVNPIYAVEWGPSGPTRYEPVPFLVTATGSARIQGGISASGALQAWADFLPAALPEVPRVPAKPAEVSAGNGFLGGVADSLDGGTLGVVAALLGLGGLAAGLAKRLRSAQVVIRGINAFAESMEKVAQEHRPQAVEAVKEKHAAEQERQGIRKNIQKARGKA